MFHFGSMEKVVALTGSKATLTLYSLSGESVYQTTSNIYNGYFTLDLDMQHYPNGMYIISLITEKETMSEKLVRQ